MDGIVHHAMPPHEPRLDDTPDPKERDLSRRSRSPVGGVWLILGLILLAAIVVYVGSAIL